MTAEHCNICQNPLNSTSGFSLSRGNPQPEGAEQSSHDGNILPTFRLCERCGNALEPVMQKLETLAAVQRRLGLDRVIAA